MIMKTGAAVSVLFLVGCSAISMTPEGRSVELLTENRQLQTARRRRRLSGQLVYRRLYIKQKSAYRRPERPAQQGI